MRSFSLSSLATFITIALSVGPSMQDVITIPLTRRKGALNKPRTYNVTYDDNGVQH